MAPNGHPGVVIAKSRLCRCKFIVLYGRFRVICGVLDAMSHSAGIRAPAGAPTLSGQGCITSHASATDSPYTIAAQLRAVRTLRVSPRPANGSQHLAALVARLVDADAVFRENSRLHIGRYSHGRSSTIGLDVSPTSPKVSVVSRDPRPKKKASRRSPDGWLDALCSTCWPRRASWLTAFVLLRAGRSHLIRPIQKQLVLLRPDQDVVPCLVFRFQPYH